MTTLCRFLAATGRRCFLLSVSSAILVAAPLPAAEGEKPVYLFILSGQSNMAGLAPDNGFLPEARRLLPEAEVVHLKVAFGGQPIRHWVKQWDQIAAAAGIDAKAARASDTLDGTLFYSQILKRYEALVEQHGKPAGVAFCWMQGERDAKAGHSAAYEPSLKQLIANLRTDLGRPDLAVVVGRLSDHQAGKPEWDAVRTAQVAVVKADPFAAWVDTDDCNDRTRPDGSQYQDLHYTAAGYTLFGQRLARQAVAVLKQQPADADGRPQP